ncbi:ADP/ATP-dependent (S)-NAD(P)H-hydrate dehydratase [Microbacterium sp. C7(2022)]|uniref:ADP-dependent NAD(P)H-hydrate dehydratase n=1 Tax=Microbacterium sp. C7(2022) TaxID=2992759 RepID=UPI00237C4B35|nr:ADP/ATP-dependent (S)-NAD(P)H-hydrate dehydratase [Microbacterium sp. C7(2022)]MDE0547269.1 NAD(P)H-hydrate dehydratase [Microbacterium sp. C7(2022)]
MSGEWTAADTATCLREPTAADDKYSRGVVGLRTGSEQYPGAAVLGVEAAWRTGVGMVRYLGPTVATSLVWARRPETVSASGRVQSWVIGSGTDAATRTPEESRALRDITSGTVPVVIDAGALDLAVGASAPVVVTPHAGEHERLRALLGLSPVGERTDDALDDAVRESAASLGHVVLLKGARTRVATPGGDLYAVVAPTSWLATAGSGDVLAGVIGAVLSGVVAGVEQRMDAASVARCAAAGAWLHGQAAARASVARSSGPVTALDVAEELPRVVAGVLAMRGDGARTAGP